MIFDIISDMYRNSEVFLIDLIRFFCHYYTILKHYESECLSAEIYAQF